MTETVGRFFTIFVTLFSIVDPLSAIPLFLALIRNKTSSDVITIIRRSVAAASGILFAFALLGTAVFSFFGITPHAFQIAGGVLLFFVGLQQVNAHETRINEDEKLDSRSREDVSLFPLAFPILAGPGALSVVILQSSKSQSIWGMVILIGVIALVMLCSYFIFLLAPQLRKLLGQTGLSIFMRLGGIILIAIAVQFVLDGIQGYLKVLEIG